MPREAVQGKRLRRHRRRRHPLARQGLMLVREHLANSPDWHLVRRLMVTLGGMDDGTAGVSSGDVRRDQLPASARGCDSPGRAHLVDPDRPATAGFGGALRARLRVASGFCECNWPGHSVAVDTRIVTTHCVALRSGAKGESFTFLGFSIFAAPGRSGASQDVEMCRRPSVVGERDHKLLVDGSSGGDADDDCSQPVERRHCSHLGAILQSDGRTTSAVRHNRARCFSHVKD